MNAHQDARRAPRARATRCVLAASLAVTLALLGGCYSSPLTATTATGAASTGGPAVTDFRGYRISVRRGEAFEIRLPSTPTVGYRWMLVDPVPPTVRAVTSAREESATESAVGAARQESFGFEAAALGTAPLLFEYRRPADPPDTPAAQRATFRVEVR